MFSQDFLFKVNFQQLLQFYILKNKSPYSISLKWQEILLPVCCGVGSLVDFEQLYSYRFVANYKSPALGLLKVLHFELLKYIFWCVTGGFQESRHIIKYIATSFYQLSTYVCMHILQADCQPIHFAIITGKVDILKYLTKLPGVDVHARTAIVK